jgi:hypothetical protein
MEQDLNLFLMAWQAWTKHRPQIMQISQRAIAEDILRNL